VRQHSSCHSRQPFHGVTFFFPSPPWEAVCGLEPRQRKSEGAIETFSADLSAETSIAKRAERTRSGRERRRNAGPCHCARPTTLQR
jgi:hypothetical protein